MRVASDQSTRAAVLMVSALKHENARGPVNPSGAIRLCRDLASGRGGEVVRELAERAVL